MKTILLFLASLLLSQCSPCRGSELINGTAVEGTVSCTSTLMNIDGEKTHLVSLDIMGLRVNRSMKFYQPRDTFWALNNWIRTRKDIVQLGRDHVQRQVTIMPEHWYGIDHITTVTGALYKDEYGRISPMKDGVQFVYDDPYTSEPVKEYLTGAITFDPAEDPSNRVYTLDLKIQNKSTGDSLDTVFGSALSGTITTRRKEITAANNVDYTNVIMTFKLDAENATVPQVMNFMTWWINCILPSF